jgi:hypothetical protein
MIRFSSLNSEQDQPSGLTNHRRLTNFPILITVALYERQAKKIGTVGVGETLLATTEHFLETLPRNIKRWSALLVFSL